MVQPHQNLTKEVHNHLRFQQIWPALEEEIVKGTFAGVLHQDVKRPVSQEAIVVADNVGMVKRFLYCHFRFARLQTVAVCAYVYFFHDYLLLVVFLHA